MSAGTNPSDVPRRKATVVVVISSVSPRLMKKVQARLSGHVLVPCTVEGARLSNNRYRRNLSSGATFGITVAVVAEKIEL